MGAIMVDVLHRPVTTDAVTLAQDQDHVLILLVSILAAVTQHTTETCAVKEVLLKLQYRISVSLIRIGD